MTQSSPLEVYPLRLTIELVPSSCWYQSLRTAIPRSAWDKLRREVYASYSYHCAICGADGRMNCHELWEYDEPRAVQTLRGFQASAIGVTTSSTLAKLACSPRKGNSTISG
jgi:hypothetical protein